ncbi:adenylate/guanylate cyclase domain-containing protein [Agaribacter flavus]|uniref:Adenylate/guanylate cyclase domain-containing protein n=1 Tax=Agaribacter flavus TaxID=1902781 RepID=A0ABV7FRL3_9ALTE
MEVSLASMLIPLFLGVVLLVLFAVYSLVITIMWLRLRRQQEYEADSLSNSIQDIDKTALIQKKADEAMALHQTFQKFVPRQFVAHFTKTGSTTLELGRADEDKVAIMFCDIRGFTGLSEKMTPQQLMNFLNSYFLRMNAPIHENNGFIDKFIGDAIMAVFDNPAGAEADKARDALSAAVGIQKALKLYNMHRQNVGYPPIRNGVGIHFGPVVIGTVGSDDRMDTTVIGDAVNVAQRIETLNDYFGSDILVSEECVTITPPSSGIEYRIVENIRLKGKSVDVCVAEVLSHFSDEERKAKLATSEPILEVIQLRKAGNVDKAEDIIHKLLAEHPSDKVILHHAKIIQQAKQDSKWNGIVAL